MSDTPPDWVLIEAAKRSGWINRSLLSLAQIYHAGNYEGYTALCDMIAKYEQPPVDRKLLCAREALMQEGCIPHSDNTRACVRAIELWEEGFGK